MVLFCPLSILHIWVAQSGAPLLESLYPVFIPSSPHPPPFLPHFPPSQTPTLSSSPHRPKTCRCFIRALSWRRAMTSSSSGLHAWSSSDRSLWDNCPFLRCTHSYIHFVAKLICWVCRSLGTKLMDSSMEVAMVWLSWLPCWCTCAASLFSRCTCMRWCVMPTVVR